MAPPAGVPEMSYWHSDSSRLKAVCQRFEEAFREGPLTGHPAVRPIETTGGEHSGHIVIGSILFQHAGHGTQFTGEDAGVILRVACGFERSFDSLRCSLSLGTKRDHDTVGCGQRGKHQVEAWRKGILTAKFRARH